MASNFTSSTILKGSDLIHEFSCTTCNIDNNNNEAQYFCEDCKKYFCDNCLKLHSRILQDHTVLGRQDVAKWGRDSDICAVHCKGLEMFCEDHQEVCCIVCVAVNHRSCGSVRHIPEISQGFNEKPEYKGLPDMIAEIKSKLDGVKRYEQEHRQEVQDAGTKLRDEIRSFREEINKLLDDIEKTTLNQLEDNEADIVTEADENIQKKYTSSRVIREF